MEIQRLLGSDIVMCFDECPALPADEAAVAASMRLSMRWAARSREAFGDRPGHALFGIVQGGVTRELREESAEALTAIGFDGYAIGGLAVGEGQAAMFGVLDYAPGLLPEDRPRYLMGVGKPDDIVGAVLRGRRHVRLRAADAVGADRAGVDPARRGQPQERAARRGPAAARSGLRLPGVPRTTRGPICTTWSRPGEIIAAMLLTWHNLHYYQELMAGLRAAIAAGRLAAFAAAFEAQRAAGRPGAALRAVDASRRAPIVLRETGRLPWTTGTCPGRAAAAAARCGCG